MAYQDKILTCSNCNGEFIFSAGEQLFFFDKHFINDPRRCKACKTKRLNKKSPQASGAQVLSSRRTETAAICANCSAETILPFKPTMNRPVLCRQCFQSAQHSTGSVPIESSAQPLFTHQIP